MIQRVTLRSNLIRSLPISSLLSQLQPQVMSVITNVCAHATSSTHDMYGSGRTSYLVPVLPQVITMRCRGYIFFGSTLQIMDDVMSSVFLPPQSGHSTPSEQASMLGGVRTQLSLACLFPYTSSTPSTRCTLERSLRLSYTCYS